MKTGAVSRTYRAAGASAMIAVVLTGCGDDGTEPPGLDAVATETEQPASGGASPDDADSDDADSDNADPDDADRDTGDAASDDEEPPAGGETHEFPDAGLTIVEPDEIPEDAAAAVATYIEFYRGWRTSLREVEIDKAVEDFGTRQVVERMESSLDYQEENGIRFGGEFVVELTIEERGDHMVVLGGCADASDLTMIDDDGERPAVEPGEESTAPVHVELTNNGGVWLINRNDINEDERCED
ncbi:hypothetical protein [Phytoactinopolyspora halophila]|uniref:hypothetical protein n=1 Tax=Phytoactinopolyspora halophila TaxID=1981511 RepID=UPI000F4DDBD6|nr:hypothetical protein [Phytoactinopolyspora halophila]